MFNYINYPADHEQDLHSDDPDAVQPDVIDRILERELRRGVSPDSSPLRHRTNKSSVYWEDG